MARLIAHRGASALAPENTLAAFRKASEIGATWVEFDVMLAVDGEVVVIHDETLSRTTNAKGCVADYPYSYLQTLDAGSWFAPEFSHEKIPTLIEVIDVLRQCKLAANVEIKPSIGKEVETVKKVLEILDKYWAPDMHPPLISSFSRTVLDCVRKYSKTHLLAYLMDKWQPHWKKSCDDLDCVSVNVSHRILTPERIAEVKSTNRLLLSYTVDVSVIAQQLFDWGVDAVFSNCPSDMFIFL